eukprot:SAG11_NODE_8244_length_1041_cov_1.990446_2_plen_102_part_00
MGQIGGLSVIPLTISLLGSLFLYISLVLTNAREEEDAAGKTLNSWVSLGLPVTLVLYVILGCGIVFFFFSIGDLLAIRVPNSKFVSNFVVFLKGIYSSQAL